MNHATSPDYADGYHAGHRDGWNERAKQLTDDRARRIRELATKWGEGMSPEAAIGSLMCGEDFLINAAAKFIDAIDDAEIPERGSK